MSRASWWLGLVCATASTVTSRKNMSRLIGRGDYKWRLLGDGWLSLNLSSWGCALCSRRILRLMRGTTIQYSYNWSMARGWESKSVESQQDLARDEHRSQRQPLSEEVKKVQRERDSLLLSRTRVLQQIEASASEQYTKVLREALKELDQKIALLEHS